MDAVLGFRVKSGWAAAVLVGGSASSPQLLDTAIAELSDPKVPETKQPHHAGFGVEQTDTTRIRRLTNTIERCALSSVSVLVDRHRAAGHRLREVAIVVGSRTDPASITNPHIRAHASEAQLFRKVLETAAGACGLTAAIFVERELRGRAAVTLHRSDESLTRALMEMGRPLRGRWRAEQKVAALAAWLVLASPGH